MKEFTHDEKVALLRQVDAVGYDEHWDTIDFIIVAGRSGILKRIELYPYFSNKNSIADLDSLFDLQDKLHTCRYREGAYYEGRHDRLHDLEKIIYLCKLYIELLDGYVVRNRWPQYCNAQSLDVIELPDLGDIV